MDIYDIEGRKITIGDVVAELPVTKDCKHVEELMKSNHVELSWEDTKQYTLSVGDFIVPYPEQKNPYDGNDRRYPIKYRLFENYVPDCVNEQRYKYEPQFQHPVMWLDRIPLILCTGDVSDWDSALKKTSWGYTGSPLHIARFITDCINWLSSKYEEFGEVFGTGWYSAVDNNLIPSATINFESVSIMSGAALMAQAFDCEYHFDFDRKEFRLGTISYGTKVTLKTGVNVGVAEVNRTKKDFYNAFLVKGSTKNLSQPTDTGENVQVTERLMLDSDIYPDGIMYTDDKGNVITRSQFLALDVPMLLQELIFEDIYPALELYLYNVRERKCWLLDDNGDRIPDEQGELDPEDGRRYKIYSKWYTRLAYPVYETNESGERVIVRWEDYLIKDYPEEPGSGGTIIDGKTLGITFIANEEDGAENSLLIGQGDFEAEYIKREETRHEDDDVSPEGFHVYPGDYRIVQKQSGNYIIPTTSAGGIYPIGSSTPRLTNNIATLLNVVVDETYKKTAQQNLEMVAKRKVSLLRSDLNNYTLPSNPIYFEENNPRLFIGQHVEYNNGQDLAGGESYILDTHIIKIETQLDYPFIKEITVGNEKVKGAITSMQDQIQTVIGGSYIGGGSGSGGGISESQIESILASYGSSLFLSKTNDDEAHGVIGFLKGVWFGIRDWFIDATGNANLNDVVANGILRAYNAVINRVKSSNFSGFGMLDSGWQIINDYEGQDSYAVFDRLYIRKKAIFEELELRKISHIGGNFCLSPASGRVWRVECYDSEVGGELLGYDIYTVPYTLGGRVLALFSHSLANRFLSRKRKIERQLTPEELARVKRIRVYMFSDDGTTKTMQNWTVGAQARCQTFNIETQMDHISGGESDNPDVDYWTGKKVQNTYWWRMVYAVGEAECEDGKKHAYIEFLENQTNQRTHSDVGSDIPSVGDEFAQFGHRTEPTQQNVIMIETANPDSPAMKFYKGVNSWSLNGKRKTVLSPAGTEIYSQRYHIETEYDDVIVPMERGEWHSGMECHYYDRVSHNGSLWLCIVVDGTSTTEEPSESSTVWIKQVGRGQDATTTAQKYTGPLAEGATKPTISNYKQFTWTDTAPVNTKELPDIYVALWKYTAGTELDINTTPPYSVSLFAHYGDDGKNGTSIVAAPNAIVINQQRVSTGGAEPLTNISYPIVVVARDSGTIVKSTVSNLSTTNCTASITKNNVTDSTVTITAISKYTEGGKEKYRTSGAVAFHVTAQTAKGDTFQADISVPFGCNLLGQYTIDIEEDVKTEVSSKVTSEIDSRNLVNVTTMNTTVQQSAAGLTQQITAVNNRLNAGGDVAESIKSTNDRVDTAETSIQTLGQEIDTVDGKFANYSTTSQTATAISTAVNSEKQRIDGVLSSSYSTTTQTSSMISSAITASEQTTNAEIQRTNERVSTAEGNITTVSKQVSGTAIDLGNADSWEQGSTNEQQGKTYEQIKVVSDSRIRTTRLFAVSKGSTQMFTSATGGYSVGLAFFDSNKLCTGGWSGYAALTLNTKTSRYEAAILIPSGVSYAAAVLAVATTTTVPATIGLSLLPTDVATESYVKQEADSVRVGIVDDLGDTGINITSGKININANNVNFCDSSGTKRNYVQITSDGKIKATDGDFSGYVNASSGKIGALSIGYSTDKQGNSYTRLDGPLSLNNGNADTHALYVEAGAKFWGTLSLGMANPGLVSDSYYNQYGKSKAIEESTPVWIATSDITLPSWCPVGTMVFVVPINSIKVKLANSSNRILAGSGEIVTESKIGRSHAIYIKTDPINMDGTNRNYWVEWYSA